jgi:hypothetical protein
MTRKATPGRRHVHEVASPAGYADALFHAAGLRPFLAGKPAPRLLGWGMGALHGGACGIRLRHIPWLDVTYLDMTSQYAAAASLAGAWELLSAEHVVDQDEDPAAFTKLLRGLAVEHMLDDPALWRRLARTFCQVIPQGDVLPHRVPSQKRWQSKLAPLQYRKSLPYNGAHLAASVLRTGRIPHIERCFTLHGEGQQRLNPVTLPSGRQIDPNLDDLLLELAIDRLLVPDPHDKAAKVTVSAACFGLLCHINNDTPGTTGAMLVIDQAGVEHRVRLDPTEQPGRWFAPPIAAAVTATGQLLLMCARLLVEQAGGTVAYWDTDSLIIPSNREGGPLRCPGGPERIWDGDEAITLLSYDQIDQVRRQMERISPYPVEVAPGEPTLLSIEPENYDAHGQRRQLYLWATAPKNYDLYTSPEPGLIELVKCSEHALGHLEPPGRDTAFINSGKGYLLRQELGLATTLPDWWDDWAISIITLTQPHELNIAQAAEDAYAEPQERPADRVMPYSRLAVAHPLPQYAHRDGGGRVTPVAPYHDGFDPTTAAWRDLYTGQPLALHAVTRNLTESDLHHVDGRVLVKTLGAAFAANHRRHDPAMNTPTGDPCTAATTGIILERPTEAYRVELISKETRNIDRAGITEDPAYTDLLDPFETAWRDHYLPTLRILAPNLLPRGRPSQERRVTLAVRAGELALEALAAADVDCAGLKDAEHACYRFLNLACGT